MAVMETPLQTGMPASEYAPNLAERLMNRNSFKTFVDNKYTAVHLTGLGAVLAGSVIADGLDRVGRTLRARDDEQEMPPTYRLLSRAIERTESIRSPALQEVAENTTSRLYLGYSALHSGIKHAEREAGILMLKGWNAIHPIQQEFM